MTIIDKRKSGKNQSAANRKKFIKRYKDVIKRSIESDTNKSIADGAANRKASVPKKDLNEPEFSLDRTTGKHKAVLPGNEQFQPGDTIPKRQRGAGQGTAGSDSGEGTDEFSFVLSKEEFMDLYFEEMELPSFIKKSLKGTDKYKMTRAGYSKDGIPPRLDILKTFKQSLARRIASESEEPRFLEEVDLRYKHFVKKPFPILQAHIFFLMDVSGSMGEYEKMLAKKFFTLLYLFLSREYEKIEIKFIRHTTNASECTEQEFFYSRESGGTIVSEGLKLVNRIIDDRINLNEMNVYVAQASDGDNWTNDLEECFNTMVVLLPKVQYFAYIQTETLERVEWKEAFEVEDLYDLYEYIAQGGYKNLNYRPLLHPRDVYLVLKDLFKKEI